MCIRDRFSRKFPSSKESVEEGLLRSSKQTKELHQTAPALHPLDSNQLELALPKTDLKEPKSKEEANQQVQLVPSQKTYTLKFRYVVRDNPNLVLYQPYEMTVREDPARPVQ